MLRAPPSYTRPCTLVPHTPLVRSIRTPRGVGGRVLGTRADPGAKLAAVPAARESHQAAAGRGLMEEQARGKGGRHEGSRWVVHAVLGLALLPASAAALDRKSTRLNSSH